MLKTHVVDSILGYAIQQREEDDGDVTYRCRRSQGHHSGWCDKPSRQRRSGGGDSARGDQSPRARWARWARRGDTERLDKPSRQGRSGGGDSAGGGQSSRARWARRGDTERVDWPARSEWASRRRPAREEGLGRHDTPGERASRKPYFDHLGAGYDCEMSATGIQRARPPFVHDAFSTIRFDPQPKLDRPRPGSASRGTGAGVG